MEYFVASEKKANEEFLGNMDEREFPKPYQKGLNTIRLGQTALSIKGERLPEYPHLKPVFIDRSEMERYEIHYSEYFKSVSRNQ